MSLMEWPKNIETFKKQKISYLKITKLNFIIDWKSIRILFKFVKVSCIIILRIQFFSNFFSTVYLKVCISFSHHISLGYLNRIPEVATPGSKAT